MKNNENKTAFFITLIICSIAIIAATVIFISSLRMSSSKDFEPKDNLEAYLSEIAELSYEEFTKGIKEDLPKEVITEIERIYSEIVVAAEEKDAKQVNELYSEFYSLNVYSKGDFEKDYDKSKYSTGK
ncbi:hypothetical protein KHQ82_07925 [Mycoplasmatota bacterium]|nr:hypothetical protein KHQ82_07925 [Mycoplasmatota bacterium]